MNVQVRHVWTTVSAKTVSMDSIVIANTVSLDTGVKGGNKNGKKRTKKNWNRYKLPDQIYTLTAELY